MSRRGLYHLYCWENIRMNESYLVCEPLWIAPIFLYYCLFFSYTYVPCSSNLPQRFVTKSCVWHHPLWQRSQSWRRLHLPSAASATAARRNYCRPVGPWEGILRPFRSGPVDLSRRLVAVGNRVYVTPGYDKPIIALTASDARYFDQAAFSDYLRKPIQMPRLMQEINKQLR